MEPTSREIRTGAVPLHPLAQALVEKGWLSPAQVQEALESARRTGKSLEAELLEGGILGEDRLYAALAELHKVRYVEVAGMAFGAEQLNLLPEYLARRHTCLPLELKGRFKSR